MKHIIVRMKQIAGALFWDLIASMALFFLLSIVLDMKDYDRTVDYLIFMIAIFSVILAMILKYQLQYKKYTRDDVTKGKNKREFERIAKGLVKGEGSYVLVYANIDRFKLINEGYGSQTGDKILRSIQKIIDDELRFDEVSGRIMSDNFGIMMRYHSIPRLDQRLYRISQQISDLEDETGNKYGVVLYFGVYVVEADDDTDISTMLEHANMARTKISPSHLVPMGIYDDRDRQRLSREKMLEMKMRTALQSGHFVPYLQPKYELKGETIAGAEALVRWIDPEEGMIFPNEFIPLFEKTDL